MTLSLAHQFSNYCATSDDDLKANLLFFEAMGQKPKVPFFVQNHIAALALAIFPDKSSSVIGMITSPEGNIYEPQAFGATKQELVDAIATLTSSAELYGLAPQLQAQMDKLAHPEPKPTPEPT